MKVVTKKQFDKMIKDQKVHDRCIAFVCPMCKTVQSMASLVDAGCPKDQAHRYIGHSCEGRWRGSGSILNEDKDKLTRGCDWTLGGLLQLHEFEVDIKGEKQPFFEPASPEKAQHLSKVFKANAV